MSNTVTIPGIVVAKGTFSLSTTSSAITLPSLSANTGRRKSNAVMIKYNGSIDIWINIDGTSAASGFGFLMNGNQVATISTSASIPANAGTAAYTETTTGTNTTPQSCQQLILYGLPSLTGVSVSGTPGIEVYLLYIPEFGG